MSWWKSGVVYQIYPRSWVDSNGDGVGDLRGITSRLDHLAWLGVDAIWLSPIYPSPLKDFGYDVVDYCAVDPVFGDLADVEELVGAAHERGLRVLLDWVPNHTSDEHPWFLESRSSRGNPKRDWYVWRDPKPDGSPPSNWLDYSGISAWRWDEASGQFFYAAFNRIQPDLNWRNPEVQQAMYETLRFWLRRGVDGFRIDVLALLVEDDQLRDNPPNPDYDPTRDLPYAQHLLIYHVDRPETRELIREIRKVVDEFGGETVLLGEIVLPLDQTVAYYGTDGDGIQVPFNFELLTAEWNARGIATFVEDYLTAIPPGGWPNWVLGNHDVPRVASRIGVAQARVAAMLMLTLPGTPTLYYGDEIGVLDAVIAPDQVRDPIAELIPGKGRDPERAPMPWDAGPGAGFTTGEPWLPLPPDTGTVNVAAQRDDPGSTLTLHRRLLALRRTSAALTGAGYRAVEADGDVLAYVREDEEERWFVALNLGDRPAAVTAPAAGRVELSTVPGREGDEIGGTVPLRPDEGIVVRLAD